MIKTQRYFKLYTKVDAGTTFFFANRDQNSLIFYFTKRGQQLTGISPCFQFFFVCFNISGRPLPSNTKNMHTHTHIRLKIEQSYVYILA